MRQQWSASSPFGQQLYFNKEEIDRMCLQALREAKSLPEKPGAIDIERFVEKHFGQVEYRDLGPGFLGCTQFSSRGEVQLVTISDSLDSEDPVTLRRLRTTLAHEAGHCLLHPSLFIQDGLQQSFKNELTEILQERRFLCRDEMIGADKSRTGSDVFRWWEYQANRAIGGFLLPKALVDQHLKEFTESSAATTASYLPESRRSDAVQSVSEIFDVNPVVARIRINEMHPEGDAQMLL